jgi:hypothetical protein
MAPSPLRDDDNDDDQAKFSLWSFSNPKKNQTTNTANHKNKTICQPKNSKTQKLPAKYIIVFDS